jgi:hypothetical protein
MTAGRVLYAWLFGRAARIASDSGLGFILLIVGAAAILAANRMGIGSGARTGPGFYPAMIGGLALAAGVALLLRAVFFSNAGDEHWGPIVIATITVVLLGADWAWGHWGRAMALRFGPAEFAAITVLKLAVIIAVTRVSRLRALGMVLLGLLIATVGTDAASGTERFTLGLDALTDGITVTTVLIGFAVADGALGVIAPSLLLASYARKLGRGLSAPPSPGVSLLLRAGGALLIVMALYAAYTLDGSGWPAGVIAVFAVFGIACQLLDWNRPVLLVALLGGAMLEESIRRSLLLSRGSASIFFVRPVSGAIFAMACGFLILAFVVSARRALAARRG